MSNQPAPVASAAYIAAAERLTRQVEDDSRPMSNEDWLQVANNYASIVMARELMAIRALLQGPDRS